MTSKFDDDEQQTSFVNCFKTDKQTPVEDSDHPKNIYVSQADFEWLLSYLADDDENDGVEAQASA